MASVCKGENGGFAGPEVVKAWKMYKELCDLYPFQEGFEITKAREAASLFHDGKAAFHLQAGAWVLTVGRLHSADKQGLSDAKLGWLFFPRFRLARVRLMTSLAPSTAGCFKGCAQRGRRFYESVAGERYPNQNCR
jgi:hypothetical protein